MTASQHDLSLPLRIVPQKDTEIVDIVEANGRLVCPFDAYDAQELVRSVNSFRQMREALNQAQIALVNCYPASDYDEQPKSALRQIREALALAEKGAL